MTIPGSHWPPAGFRLIKVLGEGAFGEVWLAKDPAGADLAIKRLKFEHIAPVEQQNHRLRFKREFAGAAGVWVAGYSNDYTGYVPSLRVLKEGGYEAAAGWAESVEDRIAAKVHEMHKKLSD